VLVVFLGFDAVAGDADNLWHKSGPPLALDDLHNLVFTEPMDLAIVLGDEFGDGPAYTNFTYAGYNFGQGVYRIGTGSGVFEPVVDAGLSQFDGSGSDGVVTEDDDGNRWTDRWECRLPWSSLGMAGPHDADCLTVAAVIGNDSTSGPDRYLSSVVIGDHVYGARDGLGNAGFNVLNLTPRQVLLPHADVDANGLPNGWSQTHFGSPTAPDPTGDGDGDHMTHLEEYWAGTDPGSEADYPAIFWEPDADSTQLLWQGRAGRTYQVFRVTNLMIQADEELLGETTAGTDAPIRFPVSRENATTGYRLTILPP
jgi:hypothetical protein